MARRYSRADLEALHELSPPWPPVDQGLVDALAEHVRSGVTLSEAGRCGAVAELEDHFAADFDRRFALAMSSGTVALQAAFYAAELAPGDEVVVTSYSYHAAVSPLLHFPVRIVFADVEHDTGNIDIADLSRKVGPQTRMIVTNHMWGHPVDVDGVVRILDSQPRRPLWVEDCSHAHYAEYRSRRVGKFGDLAVFSLQANKLVPAGEGGILLTDDQRLQDIATVWAYSLARTEECVADSDLRRLGRTGIGLKHRMHPLAATTALYYLRQHVETWLHDRNELLDALTERLRTAPGLRPPTTRSYVSSRGAYYGYKPQVLSHELRAGTGIQDIVAEMRRRGLRVKGAGSPPLYDLPLFADPPLHLPAQVVPPPRDGLAGAKAYCGTIISVPTFTFPRERPLMEAYADVMTATLDSFRAG